MAALVAFVVTLVTQACDLSVYDSAELALGALGPTLAHPPGQPLHTLLAWIFTHIPWVPRLWSITLASSVATVPLVVAASSWVFAMSEADAPPPAAGAAAEGHSRGHRLALGLVCAALVLHAPVWEMLSRVEVYALATAGIAWALARALAIVGGYIEGGARGWASVGVALGLAACANPVMGAQGGVAVLPCVLLARREGRFGVREVAAAVMGGALPLVLYALALEKLFPDERVESGRLYFCSSIGGFEEVPIPLDDQARRSAAQVAAVIGKALHDGFLPAAPEKGACERCEYRVVCGPYEEMRTARKSPERLVDLTALRRLP